MLSNIWIDYNKNVYSTIVRRIIFLKFLIITVFSKLFITVAFSQHGAQCYQMNQNEIVKTLV